ncbi:hypothetical protein PENPOL_c016G05567 [Penicillium polonicum]|uniref:Uncharacterized protein n=1 Tax=Penicillium polonicum TaxID=60169 RepID=A0A1V6N9S8_PENPO|nr:hypothetical protein PENPOL_c016G05567 [Penicillium polonicum]
MSFGGFGGRQPRTGYSTCLQCGKEKVSGFELILFSKPSKTPDRDVWQCPSCTKWCYVDSLYKNMVYYDELSKNAACENRDSSDGSDDSDESSVDGESEDDEMSDDEETSSKSTDKVDFDLKSARAGLSKMALDSSKYGGSNKVSPADEEKNRKRVIQILNGLVEHQNQANALLHQLGGLIRDVQDFNFENGHGNEEGLFIPSSEKSEC